MRREASRMASLRSSRLRAKSSTYAASSGSPSSPCSPPPPPPAAASKRRERVEGQQLLGGLCGRFAGRGVHAARLLAVAVVDLGCSLIQTQSTFCLVYSALLILCSMRMKDAETDLN